MVIFHSYVNVYQRVQGRMSLVLHPIFGDHQATKPWRPQVSSIYRWIVHEIKYPLVMSK